MNNKQSGFTLIELLVVIAIIAILASIILASLSGARGKANDAKIEEQLGSMRTQVRLYQPAAGTAYATCSWSNRITVQIGSTTGPYAFPPLSNNPGCAPGSGYANMFTDPVTTNSLLSLINGLPTNTWVTYGSQYYPPSTGQAEWYVIAENPADGSHVCVDYTGQLISVAGTPASGSPNWTTLTAPYYQTITSGNNTCK